jgi:Cft2 family RNA processing exonuclease
MQVIFIGGAQGIGASCLAIELAGKWIVVDAGVRVDRKADPLPDLALLEGKDLRAIFVTHAHADHQGALPLLHQAFPGAPIYTSRATALLMEVMLADALHIMARRAAEEMELPLYPEALVASMLRQVRPLPVGQPVTVPALEGVTIHASRAGHIAGAVSFGFVAPDGTIVVSGDISSTPQRTVSGAVPPPVDRCDLLVLESTYGARLHPNRQAEEQRLAQAVGNGLARGGHVLIPCFGLGRGQEVLLVLQAAQEQGRIPLFPIYVDGLVRRVCSTYMLLPEALAPVLQRQIRKGYMPFQGQAVTFVQRAEDREAILAGPPACILSSSGMLTGGPSVHYAARLAHDPHASILLTGYVDEESPGKRLLDLAEQQQGTLDIGGKTIAVHCTVATYSLSAHADGAELAAFASAIHPRTIALVHGDDVARHALGQLLPAESTVLFPHDGEAVDIARVAASRQQGADELVVLPRGIGQGVWFNASHIELLWKAVAAIPAYTLVTLRQLVDVWYGDDVLPEHQSWMLDTLEDEQPYDDPYFIRVPDLEEAFRIRRQPLTPEEALRDMVGQVVLIRPWPNAAKAVLCRAIEPGQKIRIQFPRGAANALDRTRYPLHTVIEVIGPLYEGRETLTEVVRTARETRRSLSAQNLAAVCREEASYTLSDLCQLTGRSASLLSDRLAVAKVAWTHPLLFRNEGSIQHGTGPIRYGLHPNWRENLMRMPERERPDQARLLSIVERHLGTPPDLVRRSVHAETGEVTLIFTFPEIAQQRYAAQLEQAAQEIGSPILIAPQANQQALASVALKQVPDEVTVQGRPSLHEDRKVVIIKCSGLPCQEHLAQAQDRFHAETGWHLQFSGVALPSRQQPEQQQREVQQPAPSTSRTLSASQQPPRAKTGPMNQGEALQTAQALLTPLPGFRKVGVKASQQPQLLVRFDFPEIAQQRYAGQLSHLETQTGWRVHVHPATRQDALLETARRVVPAELAWNAPPSIYQKDRTVVAIVSTGTASQEERRMAGQRFTEETGWRLDLVVPALENEPETPPRLSQSEALARVTSALCQATDLYRIGADTKRGILWLHFYFPAVAQQRSGAQITRLAEETGWRIEVHPSIHQKALIERARELLPEGVTPVGKASLHQDRCELRFVCVGELSATDNENAQRRFTEATGWRLDLSVTGENQREKASVEVLRTDARTR